MTGICLLPVHNFLSWQARVMSLTIEHLLSTESWQDVLKKFGNRYGVMKVFIDEQGEEDNFPFDDQEFEAKAIDQKGWISSNPPLNLLIQT